MFNCVPKNGSHRSRAIAPAGSKLRDLVARKVLLLALALSAPVSLAQGVAPDALLRAVSVKVLDQITQGQGLQANDPAKVTAMVETMIMPLFDFPHMTRLAMARNWRLATPEQQSVLIEEFKTLLVRTYSVALGNYRGEIIDFKHLRAAPFDTEVTVKSEVRQRGKERMTLDYDMENTAAGWKIYDVKVAGVRLVTTYRDIFAEEIRNVGVDGLIKSLEDRNRGGGSRFNSIKSSFWEKSRVMYEIFRGALSRGQK